MKLTSNPFKAIESGNKIIEVRLFDEKRQIINIDDEIEFSEEPLQENKINVRVIGLLRYKSFEELADDFPPEYFGAISKEDLLTSVYTYYSKENEFKYGVLGIRIKKL